ncbi:MAG TPA: hypothetical protein VHS31_15465 [Tepidisphaeraceae bacterium]|jgi:hypothetical protein|nr:hypothetical protein [Tepidisphaeraceae bacterium]
MKTFQTIFALLLLLGAAVQFLPAAETPTRHETYLERYGMLTSHNVFMKDRPVLPTTRPVARQAPVHTAEESLVLRGVALDEDGYRAYVENLNDSRIMKLGPGDLVGRGKVGEIAIDSVEYLHDGQDDWIAIGADLTGKQVITITSDSAAESGSTPTTGPAEIIDPNDPNLTLEQKMKLRRLHPELLPK